MRRPALLAGSHSPRKNQEKRKTGAKRKVGKSRGGLYGKKMSSRLWKRRDRGLKGEI